MNNCALFFKQTDFFYNELHRFIQLVSFDNWEESINCFWEFFVENSTISFTTYFKPIIKKSVTKNSIIQKALYRTQKQK